MFVQISTVRLMGHSRLGEIRCDRIMGSMITPLSQAKLAAGVGGGVLGIEGGRPDEVFVYCLLRRVE